MARLAHDDDSKRWTNLNLHDGNYTPKRDEFQPFILGNRRGGREESVEGRQDGRFL